MALKKFIFATRFLLVVFFYAMLYALFLPIDKEILFYSQVHHVYSQEGFPLRTLLNDDRSSFQHSLELEQIPKRLVEIIVQEEDKNFYWHCGIDGKGVLRAAWQNIRSKRIVSGASTISMQLARILYSQEQKNIWLKKIIQSYWALRLENNFTKKDLLGSYLNNVPMPKNCAGISCFVSAVLQKRIDLLSPTEMAITTAVIKEHSPSFKKLKQRVQRIFLEHFHASLWDEEEFVFLSQKLLSSKKQNRITSKELAKTWRSPHFIVWLNEENKNLTKTPKSIAAEKIKTTISSQLSNVIEKIIINEISFIEKFNSSNVAVIVLEKENLRWNLRAMIGSKNFAAQEGQNNGALSVRQAGSTLKPFLYALAFDRLGLRPWQRIDDIPNSFYQANFSHAIYKPKNYDLNYWGNISIAEALATSRNIPAVEILMRLGIKQFYNFLKFAEISDLSKPAQFYGPGMALGNSGAHLLGLARAYGIFAAHGKLLPLHYGTKDAQELFWGNRDPQQLFSQQSCLMINEILSDNQKRKKSFGNRSFLDFPYKVATKTGTSKDYVDSWTIGYNDRYVVGVWLGNFSGEEMNRVSGAYGAGRIFHQVFRYLQSQKKTKLTLPKDKGWRGMDFCTETKTNCSTNFYYVPLAEASAFEKEKKIHHKKSKILSPLTGEQFILDPHIPLSAQKIPVRLQLPQTDCKAAVLVHNDQEIPVQVTSAKFFKITLSPVQGKNQLALYCEDQLIDKNYFQVLNNIKKE